MMMIHPRAELYFSVSIPSHQNLGILPWYRPRSNPDGVGVTLQCVDFTDGGTKEKPDIDVKKFEGTAWEGTMKKISTGITDCSKA